MNDMMSTPIINVEKVDVLNDNGTGIAGNHMSLDNANELGIRFAVATEGGVRLV